MYELQTARPSPTQHEFELGTRLPISHREWRKQIQDAFKQDLPPSLDTVEWKGGSYISHKQFLSMRCGSPEMDPEADFEVDREIAREFWDDFPSFNAYMEAVMNDWSKAKALKTRGVGYQQEKSAQSGHHADCPNKIRAAHRCRHKAERLMRRW
ncbi:uncharacterized protein N7483_012871 [Penicillium malachiteum]|uniref:uncharacterized protein n=1 Tax=Penicillium malachiteum TaxID=1324776 RepID=UPI002547BAEA|nr:uncharacterized protein N7483_012871 [Penicillium malachiteum]KAJ5715690.1 hypothetical protein N7483_012871 [Penicillium malachiteum]